MLRWLYIQLLRAHPGEFRDRFSDEMLEAFDYSRAGRERRRLLGDCLASLFRQWVLRPEFHQPWHPVAASGPAYELLTFQQIEPYKPRGIALAQGGVLAMLLLVGVVDAINLGGNKVRTLLVGMHRPGFGLIKVDRAAFESGPLDTTVESGRDSEDPLRPFERSYFQVIRVLPALDADGDLIVSASEMLNAPAALRRLDLNHDGKLSAEECGFLPPGDLTGAGKLLALHRRDFMRQNPVLAALDTDGDGEISASEIANSAAALQALDFDRDGSLAKYELIPHRAVSQAAAMMTRFDTNDAGVIAIQEVSNEDPDAAAIRSILAAADRNRDGLVTRGELIVELAVRGGGRGELRAPQSFK